MHTNGWVLQGSGDFRLKSLFTDYMAQEISDQNLCSLTNNGKNIKKKFVSLLKTYMDGASVTASCSTLDEMNVDGTGNHSELVDDEMPSYSETIDDQDQPNPKKSAFEESDIVFF